MLSNGKHLIHVLVNYSCVFCITFTSLVCTYQCKIMRSNFAEMDHSCPTKSLQRRDISSVQSHRLSTASHFHFYPLPRLLLFSVLPLFLIAVPLMPPAQSQSRPAVGPQRFPVSSSCSSTFLSLHFPTRHMVSVPLCEGNNITSIRPFALAKYC